MKTKYVLLQLERKGAKTHFFFIPTILLLQLSSYKWSRLLASFLFHLRQGENFGFIILWLIVSFEDGIILKIP